MEDPITLHYDPQLIRSVVVSYWWRLIGPAYIVAFVFMGGMFLALVSRGARSWPIGLFAGVLIFGAVVPVAVLVAHYRQSMNRLKKMKPPQITFAMSKERFAVESSSSSSSVSWSAVSEVRRYPRFWLLFLAKSQFITLPLACFPEAAQAFLLERVRSAGGKVG